MIAGLALIDGRRAPSSGLAGPPTDCGSAGPWDRGRLDAGSGDPGESWPTVPSVATTRAPPASARVRGIVGTHDGPVTTCPGDTAVPTINYSVECTRDTMMFASVRPWTDPARDGWNAGFRWLGRGGLRAQQPGQPGPEGYGVVAVAHSVVAIAAGPATLCSARWRSANEPRPVRRCVGPSAPPPA